MGATKTKEEQKTMMPDTHKEARDRVSPTITKNKKEVQSWRADEAIKLQALVDKYGKRWSGIEKEMPGRNIRQIRNRWLRMEAGADETALTKAGRQRNRCQTCNRVMKGHICAIGQVVVQPDEQVEVPAEIEPRWSMEDVMNASWSGVQGQEEEDMLGLNWSLEELMGMLDDPA